MINIWQNKIHWCTFFYARIKHNLFLVNFRKEFFFFRRKKSIFSQRMAIRRYFFLQCLTAKFQINFYFSSKSLSCSKLHTFDTFDFLRDVKVLLLSMVVRFMIGIKRCSWMNPTFKCLKDFFPKRKSAKESSRNSS